MRVAFLKRILEFEWLKVHAVCKDDVNYVK